MLVSSDKLSYSFVLGESSNEALDGLTQSFIEKYGEEVYTKASKIIIVEEHFYNIIKNRYGPTSIGDHNDFLEETIETHLDI